MRQVGLQKEVLGSVIKLLRPTTKPSIAILLLPIEFAPRELGGEGKEIPHCMRCPACEKGVLRRHDDHSKTVKDLNGRPLEVKMLRVKCSNCGDTYTCMPYPMLPYKKHTVPAVTGMIDDYISRSGTYFELASGAAPEEDFKSHTHLLFCLLERVLERIAWIEEWLQKVRFGRRESLWQGEAAPRKECPNAWKARKPGKADKLNRARTAVALMQRIIGEVSFSEEIELAGRQLLTAPISLLTSARVLDFLTPHNRELALF